MAILGSYVLANSRAAPRQPRARVPDVVGSGLPSPYHFRAQIQSFQGVAAICGRLRRPFAPRSGRRNASVRDVDDRLGGGLLRDGDAGTDPDRDPFRIL